MVKTALWGVAKKSGFLCVDAALQIVDLLMAEEYEFVTVEELILP